jgi:hypothetical protein
MIAHVTNTRVHEASILIKTSSTLLVAGITFILWLKGLLSLPTSWTGVNPLKLIWSTFKLFTVFFVIFKIFIKLLAAVLARSLMTDTVFVPAQSEMTQRLSTWHFKM